MHSTPKDVEALNTSTHSKASCKLLLMVNF